jgi:hypothetical protein
VPLATIVNAYWLVGTRVDIIVASSATSSSLLSPSSTKSVKPNKCLKGRLTIWSLFAHLLSCHNRVDVKACEANLIRIQRQKIA